MQEKLIIFLENDRLLSPSWAVITNDGNIINSVMHDQPENLLPLIIEKEIIVIVPAEDVSLAEVSIPKMSYARLLQAIPYALEDQLVGELEQLHFAFADHQANGKIPVAVVSKEKMQQWTNLLKSWSIQPDVITSLVFALPYTENNWTILINKLFIARTGVWTGFAGDKENLSTLLEFAIHANEHAPNEFNLQNYSEHAYASQLTELGSNRENFFPPEELIANLAKQIIRSKQINLLQQKYAHKKLNFLQLNKLGKITLYLAAAWIFLLILYPTISYFIINRRVSVINSETETIYRRHFPQATSIIAPKNRLQEKLNRLHQQGGEDRLFLLLNDIGKSILRGGRINLERLDYQNNQITLKLTAENSQDFANFTDSLSQQGLSVKQQNADLTGSRITASLLIE